MPPSLVWRPPNQVIGDDDGAAAAVGNLDVAATDDGAGGAGK